VRAFFRLNTMQLIKNNLPSRKESEVRFISILKEHGFPVTREQAAKLTGYSLHHAGKYLCHLRAMGILTSEKVKGETRWAISGASPVVIPTIARGNQINKLAGVYVPPVWHIRAGAGELRRAGA
jgi:hypothetical protein